MIGAHLDTSGSALLQLGSVDQVDHLVAAMRLAGLALTEVRTVPGRGVVAHLRRR